ncbi:two-component system sensor kinase [Escherichia coli]|uniref:Two-component system sensor kinase n=1 Tax=Escherichia coli TaxID=562 RepID=A0A376LBX4_ECOLX|nr:two-component system sensor kinase [Escherichia coli]
MDIYHTAQQAKIDVRLTLNAHGIKRTGQPLLLSLLVRNLLDNACATVHRAAWWTSR